MNWLGTRFAVSGDRLLDSFAPDLSHAAHRALERLGVEIVWDNRVVEIDANGVFTRDPTGTIRRINAYTVLFGPADRGRTRAVRSAGYGYAAAGI